MTKDVIKPTPFVELRTASPVRAGSLQTWKLAYTTPNEILPGGGIRIAVDCRGGMGQMQVNEPTEQGFVSVSTNGTAKFRATSAIIRHPLSVGLAGSWNPEMSTNLYVVDVTVQGEAGLNPGDKIYVVIGDRDGGGPGIRAPYVAVRDLLFWIMTYSGEDLLFPGYAHQLQLDHPKANGILSTNQFACTASNPSICVLPEAAEHMEILAVSRLKSGQNVLARAITYDKYWNPVRTYKAHLTVPEPKKLSNSPIGLTFSPEDGGDDCFKGNIELRSESCIHITAKDSSSNLHASSNPAEIVPAESSKKNLYWGDIHGHTLLSDGSFGDPDDYFTYARDIAGLDFCALTDHDFALAYRGLGVWQRIQRCVRRYNHPSRFVTLLGFESTHSLPGPSGRHTGQENKNIHYVAGQYAGHKNVYFPGDSGTLVNTSPYYGPRRTEIHGRTIGDLFDGLEDTSSLVIPHQNCNTDWSFRHPSQRLVEIYSKWGCSEFYGCSDMVWEMNRGSSVQDALAAGHKLGFVAGSDTHMALPGNKYEPHMINLDDHRPGGLTAVFAMSLTREAVWEALWNRRVYATTGARIIMDVHVNGQPMGSILDLQGGEAVEIVAGVMGTVPIKCVEIVKNGHVVYRGDVNGTEIEFEWRDKVGQQNDYYYLRVEQEDGHRAWSSPVWISTEFDSKG